MCAAPLVTTTQAPAARDPSHLGHGPSLVRYVVEHVSGEDNVEGFFTKWHALGVGVDQLTPAEALSIPRDRSHPVAIAPRACNRAR